MGEWTYEDYENTHASTMPLLSGGTTFARAAMVSGEDTSTTILDRAFHFANGKMGAGEKGLDAHVRLFQRGTKWVALLTVATVAGPVSLAAAADEKVVAGLLARAMACGKDWRGMLAPGAEAAIKASAQRVAQQIAKEAVVAKVSGLPSTPSDKNAAAARLYTRLTQKDPTAWQAAQKIVAFAKDGNPKALEAWTLLMRTHYRARAASPAEATPAQCRAAHRLYKRLRAKDQSAWAALLELLRGAEQGLPKHLHAWNLLGECHRRYACAQASAQMSGSVGAVIGGATPVKLTSAQSTNLMNLARKAAVRKLPAKK